MPPNPIIRIKETDYIYKRFLKNKPGFFDFWVCDQTRLAVESQIRLATNCYVRFTTIDNQTHLSAVDLDQSRYSAVDNQARCPAVVYQSR